MSTQDDMARVRQAAHRRRVAEQAQRDLAREGWLVVVDTWQIPTRDKAGVYGFSTEGPDGTKYSSTMKYETSLLALEAGVTDAYDGIELDPPHGGR